MVKQLWQLIFSKIDFCRDNSTVESLIYSMFCSKILQTLFETNPA